MRWASYEPHKHLLASEIYPPEEKCPICGDAGQRDIRLVIQKDPDVLLLRCRRCFGLSASHMPTREVLDEIYRSYYVQGKQERVIFQNPSRLAHHIVSSIDFPANTSGEIRVLDFGGGDGSIAQLTGKLIAQATRQPIQIQVVDYVEGIPSQRGPGRYRVRLRLKGREQRLRSHHRKRGIRAHSRSWLIARTARRQVAPGRIFLRPDRLRSPHHANVSRRNELSRACA